MQLDGENAQRLVQQYMDQSTELNRVQVERDQLRERVDFLEKLVISMSWAWDKETKIPGTFSDTPSAI